MADENKMSVEEILAACRAEKSGESASSTEETSPAESSPGETSSPAAASSGKKASEMSVEEMLAAARAGKGGSSSDDSEESTAVEPVTASSAPAKKASEMSVAEMLAAARSGKGGGAQAGSAPTAKTKPAAKPKPAAKATSSKKSDSKKAVGGPLDTQSILAAARKEAKAGPMSKAEAAAKSVEAPPKKKSAPPMPEKPAYAIPPVASKPATAEDDSRRGFMAGVMGCFAIFFGSALNTGFTSLGLTGLISTLGFARFMFPNILTEPPTKFKAGFPADLSTGQVETKFKAQFGVWIVRSEYEGQSQIYALSTVCTHLGCTPNWLEAEQKFKCPCHGSGFYKDGVNFEGPAPRPLERYAIKIADDGQMEVDKSRTFQEEMGQWSDPSCYITPV